MQTRILTASDVRAAVPMPAAVEAVEAVFAAHGRGETQMPVKVYLELDEHEGDFRAMPAFALGSAGVKWVNAHPRNPERHGLPSVMGMYVLSDPATAEPLAVLDATLLTALRTGTAAGVATKYLARKDAQTIGFIGSGVQARTMLAAIRAALGRDLHVLAADVDSAAAETFAGEAGGRAVSVEEACGADVVCTATPVREPIVRDGWIGSGQHINAMGADAHGKQEIDAAVLRRSLVVVDDVDQASGSGEVNVPLSQGELQSSDLHASLGEIVAGRAPGRTDDAQITLFDSTGLAVQDVALARLAYDRAEQEELGLQLDFRS